MKPRFFSFAALLAIALTLPTQTFTTNAAPAQMQKPETSSEKHDTSSSHGLKQASTTVPLPGTNPNEDPGPSLSDALGNPNENGSLTPHVSTAAVALYYTKRGESAGLTDRYVQYQTDDGSNWTVQISPSGQFTHTRQGANSGHTDTIIRYLTWDGQIWTATVDPASKLFTHTRQGDGLTRTSNILHYLAWDGSQWEMRLQ
ncbi:DUF4751 family protein [cf. Phormidesmis sp. LEGE 11477]|uniref:DUF4751 family protein n=1 Tax=cf. Phormidesmis sp. LEGE 11477 TaxID=1828680 RepID=UPI00187E43A7|nr:DUF4751 family protein [cf. Phormidesmis sp. LEGE 11477]MBE9062993.1 DUF4751 family protein [cf. Phormidesmis sp. LEGE 11477]